MALNFKKQLVTMQDQVSGVLNEVQDGILDIVNKLNDNRLNGSVFLEDVEISTTSRLIRHGLGFEPTGWIICNPKAAYTVYEDTTASNPNRREFLNLLASSGSDTVNIIIF